MCSVKLGRFIYVYFTKTYNTLHNAQMNNIKQRITRRMLLVMYQEQNYCCCLEQDACCTQKYINKMTSKCLHNDYLLIIKYINTDLKYIYQILIIKTYSIFSSKIIMYIFDLVQCSCTVRIIAQLMVTCEACN